MTGSSDVVGLFDDKAETWGEKYAPGGPLRERLLRFRAALARQATMPKEVLDLGCGAGDLAAHLASFGFAVTAADASARMIEVARRRFGDTSVRWQALPTDWRTLPWPVEAFDAVVASSVFEYVPDVSQVLSELARVLRSGGSLLATVPNPDHPVRVLEAAADRVGRLPWVQQAARGVRRIDRFLRYLEASKNRFLLSEWEERLRAAGLVVEPPELGGPLCLLVAHKV